jgi:hypothetical protein
MRALDRKLFRDLQRLRAQALAIALVIGAYSVEKLYSRGRSKILKAL